MEWPWILLLIFGSLILMLATGMPVAFCFLLIILIGGPLIWGFGPGTEQVILGMAHSMVKFTLLPLPLFILMGEVLFCSGIAPFIIDTVDKWLGRLPGRLGLVSVGAGVLFATLTGTGLASIAMLGETLVPEMERRGYKRPMSLGPIMGGGGLAIMIPPSGLAVLLGAIGQISIGKILMAIIMPGLLMAILYAIYIITRCWLQSDIAPPYTVRGIPISEKLISFAKYILPIGFIIFLVVGVIFVGIATPTEAAATGALGTFILVASYRRLNWQMVKKSLTGTIRLTVMMFMIMTASKVFSQILSFSGAAAGLSEFAADLPVAPILIIIGMQMVLLILGSFMEPVSIMMITLPIFMPVVNTLVFDPVWFAVLFLINAGSLGGLTPPFGLSLFVMKGVAPSDTTIGECIRAALPFIIMNLITMALIMAFPAIALWMPGLMGQ